MREDEELEMIKTKKLKELLKKSQDQKTDSVVVLTSLSFAEFLKNTDLPVLVDFWAEWCMPCRIMAPVIEELARDYRGKAMFAKVNVDKNPEIASRFNIMSIPHFIVFKKEHPVERIVGAVGREQLEDTLKKHL